MSRSALILATGLFAAALCAQLGCAADEPTDLLASPFPSVAAKLVDPFIGTAGEGNTFRRGSAAALVKRLQALFDGGRFVITAPRGDASQIYVTKMTLGGKAHGDASLSHAQITGGGTLVLTLSAQRP